MGAEMTDATTAPEPPADAPSGPSAADLAALRAYVRTLADRMGLRDWTVEVRGATPDVIPVLVDSTGEGAEELFAVDIDFVFGPRAILYFGPEYDALDTPERRRQWVACKLLKCHQAFLDEDIRKSGVSRYKRDGLRGQANLAAATIAAAWAPALPLPLVGFMKRANDES
jgi:hypothetical protein